MLISRRDVVAPDDAEVEVVAPYSAERSDTVGEALRCLPAHIFSALISLGEYRQL